MNIDLSVLPQKGNKIRIRIRQNLWLYAQVESIAPSMTFITLKVLGIKEDSDEVVGTPTRLVDPSDPLGPVERTADRSSDLPAHPRGARNPDLPPSPSALIDEEKDQNDIPF